VKRLVVVLLLLLAPSAQAQGPLPEVTGLAAQARNHEVQLSWDPTPDPQVVGYVVSIYLDGELFATRNTTNTNHVVSPLTNQLSYAFIVASRDASGNVGPASAPVAATPTNDRDLPYLAAGLMVTWLSIFGYAALLARREAQLDRKLDQILDAKHHEENR